MDKVNIGALISGIAKFADVVPVCVNVYVILNLCDNLSPILFTIKWCSFQRRKKNLCFIFTDNSSAECKNKGRIWISHSVCQKGNESVHKSWISTSIMITKKENFNVHQIVFINFLGRWSKP